MTLHEQNNKCVLSEAYYSIYFYNSLKREEGGKG